MWNAGNREINRVLARKQEDISPLKHKSVDRRLIKWI